MSGTARTARTPAWSRSYGGCRFLGIPFPGREQHDDATFGLQRTDQFVLPDFGIPHVIPRRDARPVFDDTDPLRFYTPFADAGVPRVGVIVAGAGVRLEVEKQSPTGMTVRLHQAELGAALRNAGGSGPVKM